MPPPDEREVDDEGLVGRAQKGDVSAFEALLLRHEAKVLRVLGFLGVPAGWLRLIRTILGGLY